ncbi:MarR family transcriptional regulator, partial [Frankia sp. CNm7]|nr:MarR family transcriptional regulator [Frankia nepalensis]
MCQGVFTASVPDVRREGATGDGGQSVRRSEEAEEVEVTEKDSEGVNLEGLLRELVSAAQLYQSAAGVRARLTPTELAVLVILRARPRLAGQLAVATQLTTGAITRVLDGLERRGYVVRVPDPDDRRRVVVTAVVERLTALDTLFGPMSAAAAGIQATFTPAEQRVIARFLTATGQMLRDQTDLLRGGAGATAAPVTLEAPLGVTRHARLHLAGGLRRLTILDGGPDLPTDRLYRASFSTVPTIEVVTQADETDVRIRFGRRQRARWRGHGGDSTLTLSPRVDWTVDVRGGADQLLVDVPGLPLRSFSLTGGVQDLRLRLGTPREPARIALTGGAERLRLERPAGVPVRPRLRGGASRVVIDGEDLGSQGSGGRFQASGRGRGGYELALTGGVTNLEIATLG